MPKRYNTPHRSHVVKTRLTDEEYADFTERLAPYGISQSEFLRQAIRRTTIRPVLHVSSVNDELLSAVGKLTAEYGRIGGNLNQIARTLNEWHMLSFAEQANREYKAELYGQQAAPTPDDRETGETVRTPRGTFHVTDMSREQMEAAGYGFHHESEDRKYVIMANGSCAFAIPNGDAPGHTAPKKMTVLVVEPMKEPYVKEIDPGLHALQAEVGGDIAASYPFDDPVGLVLNDEGKLIGLDLNRSLRDEHGEIYDIVAGTFLVVGLGPESFASLPPDMIQKYTEQFKRPELFASINGQIVSVPVEPENPLRTAEMTLEDDYGMIDGIINNGRRGEELEKAQSEACRTTPEKKPSIRERLEDAKRECGSRKGPDKPAPQKKPPELGDL